MKVVKSLWEHIFMNKQKCMGSCVEWISDLTFLCLDIDDIIYYWYNRFWKFIHVEYGWISIHTNRVELITVLNKEYITLIISYESSLKTLYYNYLLPYKRAFFILSRQPSILPILSFAIGFLNFINSLVSIDRFIPSVEETSFSLF